MSIKKITNYILNSKPLYKSYFCFLPIFFNTYFFPFKFNIAWDDFIGNFKLNINYIILLTVISPPIYIYTGQYRSLARYFSNYSTYKLILEIYF